MAATGVRRRPPTTTRTASLRASTMMGTMIKVITVVTVVTVVMVVMVVMVVTKVRRRW